MSTRQRLHVPGGTYYVVQRGSAHLPIFSQPEDYSVFERLLAATLHRTGARVHAYCWMPQSIHLVVQIGEIPVGEVMKGLTSRYALCMRERVGEFGPLFKHRYKALLIDPDTYLLKLIHHIHHLPVLAELAPDLGTYPFTSHSAYMRVSTVLWLTTQTAFRLLDGCDETSDYAESMNGPAPPDVHLFENVGSADLRVIGRPAFLASLPRHSRPYRSKVSLDQIILTITSMLGVERERVLSSSRKHELVLARALIAWYATERHVASLKEVARRLGRHPSTLSGEISGYRLRRPKLFDLTAIHDVVPLG